MIAKGAFGSMAAIACVRFKRMLCDTDIRCRQIAWTTRPAVQCIPPHSPNFLEGSVNLIIHSRVLAVALNNITNIRHSRGNGIGVRFSHSIKRYVQHSKGIVFSIIYSSHTAAVGSPFIPHNIDGYTNNHDSTHVIGSDIFVWNTWNATQGFQYTTWIIHGYAASLPTSVMGFGRYMTCRLEGGEMYGALKEIWITGHNGITTEESFKYLY